MQLRNHIAYRFLTDEKFTDEILYTMYPSEFKLVSNLPKKSKAPDDILNKLGNLYRVASIFDQKAYYITDTVLDKLSMLKVSKKDGLLDWTVFRDVEDRKLTFIYRDNKVVRLDIRNDVIQFIHIKYLYHTKEVREKNKYKHPGDAYFVFLWVDRKTGQIAEHFSHPDGAGLAELLYKNLCFFFLTENEEIVVPAGKRWGTKKQPDALSNDSSVPVTIVNSRWNITSIRTEGFSVSGHFAIRWCGEGRKEARIVFIEPYQKHGYTRRAGKELGNG